MQEMISLTYTTTEIMYPFISP